MIGALVRAALACQVENKQQSGEWKHVLLTRSGGARRIEEFAEDDKPPSGSWPVTSTQQPSTSEGEFHDFGPPRGHAYTITRRRGARVLAATSLIRPIRDTRREQTP